MAHHFGRQVPCGATINVDYRKLAECFTLVKDDKTELHPKFWELHPGSDIKSSKFDCTRQESVERWKKHKEKHARLMPAVVRAAQQGMYISSCICAF